MAIRTGSSGLPMVGVEYIAKNVEKFRKDLDSANNATEKQNKQLTKAQRAAEAWEKGLSKASTIGTAAVIGFGAAGLKMAANFETAFAQVQTLFPGAEDSIEHLRGGVQNLSSELGISAVGSTEALYDALSASVPPENALTFLETASKAAVGGAIDTKTAVNVLTSTMNAFGIESSRAEEVSDILFTTVAKGKTTMGELARAMFNVAPAAAAAGLSLDETAAAIASITKQGVPTTVATTQLRQAIVELQKPGEQLGATLKAIGFDSGLAALEALGLQGTLQALAVEADNSGKNLSQVFSSVEAAGAALALTGQNFETATSDLEAMGGAAGTTAAAFNTMNQTTARQFEIAKERIKTNAIVIMQDALPAVNALLEGVGKLTSSFSKLDPATQQLLFGLGAMVIALPKLANSFGLSATRAGAFGVVLAGITLGVDQLLQKTTGDGLTTHLFGEPGKNERQAQAQREIANALAAQGEEVETLDVLREVLSDTAAAYDVNAAAAEENGLAALNLNKDIKQQEETVRAVAEAMRNSGATMGDLQQAYLSLSPEMRKVFVEATGLTQATIDQGAAMDNARKTALDPAIQRWMDARDALEETTEATEDLTSGVSDNRTAFDEYINTLTDANGELLTTQERADKVREAIEQMTGTLATSNPVVIGLKAENVLLNESIQDLKTSGVELTAEQEAYIEATERTIEENERLIAGYADNQTAVEGLQQSVELVAGDRGLARLLVAFQDLETPQERQVAIMGNISEIQQKLANNDIPGAIEQFGILKDSLSPEEWRAIGEAVGPELLGSIQGSISDPGQIAALIEAARGIGGSLSAGIAAGLVAGGASVTAAMQTVIGEAEIQAMIDQGILSPSKKTRDLIGLPLAEGIAVGIREGGPGIESAMQFALDSMIETARASNLPDDARAFGVGMAMQIGEGMTEISNGRLWTDVVETLMHDSIVAFQDSGFSTELRDIAQALAEGFSEAFGGTVDMSIPASAMPRQNAGATGPDGTPWDELGRQSPGVTTGNNTVGPAPPVPGRATDDEGNPLLTSQMTPEQLLDLYRQLAGGITGHILFHNTGNTHNARLTRDGLFYETTPGRWVKLSAANVYDPASGLPTGDIRLSAPGFYTYKPLQEFHEGTTRVPRTGPYMLERNEAVIPAAFNPWAMAPVTTSSRSGRDIMLTVDLSGSSFMGEPEENARAIGDAVREVLADEIADIPLYSR